MSSTSKYLALKRSYKTQKRRVILTRLKVAWRRPTLTGTRSQLPSALESLTSVFGMGTGVTSLPSLPDCIHLRQESF